MPYGVTYMWRGEPYLYTGFSIKAPCADQRPHPSMKINTVQWPRHWYKFSSLFQSLWNHRWGSASPFPFFFTPVFSFYEFFATPTFAAYCETPSIISSPTQTHTTLSLSHDRTRREVLKKGGGAEGWGENLPAKPSH